MTTISLEIPEEGTAALSRAENEVYSFDETKIRLQNVYRVCCVDKHLIPDATCLFVFFSSKYRSHVNASHALPHFLFFESYQHLVTHPSNVHHLFSSPTLATSPYQPSYPPLSAAHASDYYPNSSTDLYYHPPAAGCCPPCPVCLGRRLVGSAVGRRFVCPAPGIGGLGLVHFG